MEIVVSGDAKEIAALVLALQERQGDVTRQIEETLKKHAQSLPRIREW